MNARTSSPKQLFPEPEAEPPAPAPSFDAVRTAFPHFGLALYALEPRGLVVLEVHADGEVYSFSGESADAVFAAAFPEERNDVFG